MMIERDNLLEHIEAQRARMQRFEGFLENDVWKELEKEILARMRVLRESAFSRRVRSQDDAFVIADELAEATALHFVVNLPRTLAFDARQVIERAKDELATLEAMEDGRETDPFDE